MSATDSTTTEQMTVGTVPGQTNSAQSNFTNSGPAIPPWQMQGLQTIVGQGAALASRDYTPYEGQRIADFTPDQLNSQQLFRQQAASTQVDPTQMQNNLSYGLSGFDPNEVNKYMSPYTTGVINEISRLGNQNLQENVLPSVNSTFTGAGQFGSTRNQDFTNRAVRDTGYNILGQQSNALQAAETNALGQYNQWHQNALGNAGAAQNLQAQGAANLNQQGALQQTMDQSNLNLAYQDFQNQQNYPQQQWGWYNDLLHGTGLTGLTATSGGGSQSSTSTTEYKPSYMANVTTASPAQAGLATGIGTFNAMSGG